MAAVFWSCLMRQASHRAAGPFFSSSFLYRLLCVWLSGPRGGQEGDIRVWWHSMRPSIAIPGYLVYTFQVLASLFPTWRHTVSTYEEVSTHPPVLGQIRAARRRAGDSTNSNSSSKKPTCDEPRQQTAKIHRPLHNPW